MRNTNFLNNGSESISTKMTLKSHKLLIGALTLVLVAGMSTQAFALTIDDFSSGSNDITANSTQTLQSNTNSALPTDETVGGERKTTVMWISGDLDLMANSNPPAGIMALSSDSGTLGIFKLTYNGTGNTGLGGLDVTLGGAGDRLIVNMTDADLGSDVSFWLTDTNGIVCSLEFVTLASGPQVIDFPYANFDTPATCNDANPAGNIDFESINTIEFRVDGVTNGDYEIDLIGVPQMRVGGTVGSMSTIPLLVAGAQANMGLWSLALVGVVATGAAIIYKTKSNKTEQ